MGMKHRPEIVIGIDIGQTCSGVAFSIGPDWSDPRTIREWPGLDSSANRDKVATRLGYNKQTGQVDTWGFQTNLGDENVHVREQFKLTLDDEYEDDRGYTTEDARTWYCDYLGRLRLQIEQFFDRHFPHWRSVHIEYNFSTPTTWRNPAMIASIESLIRKAGFGDGPKQTIRMGSTEAEAAAIEAHTTQYRKGDVFMICDAGGGTTDINVLRVISAGQTIKLEPLDSVEGVAIGSTLIDYRIAQHFVERLDLIRDHLEGDLFLHAEEMLVDRFQLIKHSFPEPVVDQYWLDVKGLAGSHDFPEAGIVRSRMSLSQAKVKEIFDEQLEGIFALIDDRLLALQLHWPDVQVNYIILSGGLGSSPYVMDKIQQRYGMNAGFRSNNIASLRTVRVPEPQLAVVRGLVRERTQQLGASVDSGDDAFTARRCRNSYGTAVRIPYDPKKHRGLEPVINPSDKGRWVEDQIHWFIKQGEEIPADGINCPYAATLRLEDHDSVRAARIFMSTAPPDELPSTTKDARCKQVVVVHYKLTGNDMKLKNKKFWKPGKRYFQAQFNLVIQLGAADLRFQIRGKYNILSSDHDSLEVEYMDPYDVRKKAN